MKKIFGILCLITLSLAGVSCHGDLDIAQKGQVTGGDAWGSQSNALANMYGMMSTFRAAFATDYMYWGEYRTQIWGKETRRSLRVTSYIPTTSLRRMRRRTGRVSTRRSTMPT